MYFTPVILRERLRESLTDSGAWQVVLEVAESILYMSAQPQPSLLRIPATMNGQRLPCSSCFYASHIPATVVSETRDAGWPPGDARTLRGGAPLAWDAAVSGVKLPRGGGMASSWAGRSFCSSSTYSSDRETHFCSQRGTLPCPGPQDRAHSLTPNLCSSIHTLHSQGFAVFAYT